MPRALLLLVAALLSACGQRGDLFIPEPEREAVLTVPADLPEPAPAPPEEEDEPSTGQQAR